MDSIFIVGIKHDTIVDGDGFRTSVYSSYCKHHCPMCHNKRYWELESGISTPIQDIYKEIISNSETNVTFSGGDPMFQAKGFLKLAKLIKENTNKTIWCYTGFTYNEIINGEDKDRIELLNYIDILVDGKYEQDKRALNLRFRGSSNQNILLVQESLKQNKVVLYEELMK